MGMEQRENLGSAMVVGMERGLFTFPNDRLASSGRGRDLLPIEGSFLMRISAVTCCRVHCRLSFIIFIIV